MLEVSYVLLSLFTASSLILYAYPKGYPIQYVNELRPLLQLTAVRNIIEWILVLVLVQLRLRRFERLHGSLVLVGCAIACIVTSSAFEFPAKSIHRSIPYPK